MRSGGLIPPILTSDTRWRWVVSLKRRLLYPWGKSLRYTLDRRLGRTDADVLEAVAKRKIPSPRRQLNPALSSALYRL